MHIVRFKKGFLEMAFSFEDFLSAASFAGIALENFAESDEEFAVEIVRKEQEE